MDEKFLTNQSVSCRTLILSILIGIFCTTVKVTFFPFKEFIETDLFAYWSGWKLFMNGSNPYDPQVVLDFQRIFNPYATDPCMTWNPPFIFILLTPLFSFSEEVFRCLLSLLSFTSITATLLILSTTKNSKSLMIAILILINFYPIQADFYFEQFSSVLLGIFMCSIVCLKSRQYLLSGIFISFLLVKPHIILLPLSFLALHLIWHKEFKVILTVFFSILTLSMITEVIHPNITYDWVFRKTWPSNIYGSTSLSLLVEALKTYEIPTNILRILFISLSFICSVLIYRKFKNNDLTWELISSLLVLNTILTPYGFYFDEVYLIIPIIILMNSFTGNIIQILTISLCLAIHLAITQVYNWYYLFQTLPLYWFHSSWIITCIWFSQLLLKYLQKPKSCINKQVINDNIATNRSS